MNNKLKVYYDGLCLLCSTEIEHYKRQKGSDQIDFIDICEDNFNPAIEELDPYEIHKIMHARRPDGTVVTRVQAFVEIWERLPKYKKLARLAKVPVINIGLEAGYSIFAKIRPYLPKKIKKEDCKNSPYCEIHHE